MTWVLEKAEGMYDPDKGSPFLTPSVKRTNVGKKCPKPSWQALTPLGKPGKNFSDEYWKLSVKNYFPDDKGWYCWQWQPAPVLFGTWRQNCLPRYQFWTHMIARVVVMMMIIDYHYNFNSDYYSQGWLSDVEPTQADGNSAAVLNASPQRKCRIFSFIWSSVVWKKRSLRVDDDDGSDQEDRLVPCGKL